jgi:transcriptional regulator of nitric oxide reductase
VVIDDQGCQAVLNGSTAALVWRSCDWELSAFSSDGQLGAGRSVAYGTFGVIDLSTGKLALGIQQDMTPVGPQMVFDEADRLNFRVGSPPVGQPKIGTRVDGFAFMVCDLAGVCWLSTASHADPIEFVLPNRQ